MLIEEIKGVILASKEMGWILEPETKRLLSLAGLDIPRFKWVTRLEEALGFAGELGYPVVAKVVSPKVLHKSDVGGVITGIDHVEGLTKAFRQLSALDGSVGILVEEMLSGVELMLGAKNDYQFGPVILLGMGGTGVEIYRDTTLRMAPLRKQDINSMLKSLKAHELLEGYRGSRPINLEALKDMMMKFSRLVMDLEWMFESIDLNPLMCSPEKCVVADARIILNKERETWEA